MINSSNYTIIDKLFKQKLENDDLHVPFSIMRIPDKKLSSTGKLVYSLMKYRNQLSFKHPYIYYDNEGQFYFINFQITDLMYLINVGRKAVRNGINQLDNLGLIIKHKPKHFGRATRFELPKCQPKCSKGTSASTEREHAERTHNLRTHRTGKTVNTGTGETERKFKSASAIASWKDSATKMGLTLDTINLIAKFSNTYGQSAYKITHFIAEARDIVANKYHITKRVKHFETNNKIINRLAKKLRILFSHITSKDYHKAKLSNYAGFLINSLKRFFKWAFGKDRDETVTPKTDDRHFNSYRKRKPIKEDIPQWMKDQQAGKAPKTEKTDKSLTNLIQARQNYDTLVMQADDPMKPDPDTNKVSALKKQLNHCQKLYDAKHRETKPAPKPKQHKQAKNLHKTSRALQREIQARLRRLGEE